MIKKTRSKAGAPPGNKNAVGNDGGRPTKYKPEFAKQANRLALLGLTDKEIAAFLEIAEPTIYEWKAKYIEFSKALRAGKLEPDGKVAAALYKRAIGYKYIETQRETAAGNVIREKKTVKHLPPDVGAAIMWLKNRHGDKWRDRTEIDFDKLTDEQLDRFIARMKSKST
ncbi:MAG: hypothetical protein HZA79_05065 [Sphingobacteriales bacterium]|nr:hypothetical protein [Sphingobacteriales bacterium]